MGVLWRFWTSVCRQNFPRNPRDDCSAEGRRYRRILDHENSFDVGLAEVMGLQSDEDEGNWVYKQPDTFEDAIDLTGQILSLVRKESLIPAEAPIVIVYDSLASMVPRQKFEKFEKMADGTAKEKDELNMNDNTALARATSANLPTLAKWAQKYNACLIFLNQVRTKWA